MKKINTIVKNTLITIAILLFFFAVSLFIHNVFQTRTLIPALFTLAVFLVSLLTHGYVYGVTASLISVLAVNFAFTYPYLKFNFSIVENVTILFFCHA
jgi:two-component system sensor histidine kinase KdpD